VSEKGVTADQDRELSPDEQRSVCEDRQVEWQKELYNSRVQNL